MTESATSRIPYNQDEELIPVEQTNILVFNRREKKYLIKAATAAAVIQLLGQELTQDTRGSTTIHNLYLDTPDFSLIRRSIEKPLYKEKLRIRIYGDALSQDHEAFIEIKKKLKGRVYKRRLALPLGEAQAFIEGAIRYDTQIGRELGWSIQSYGTLQPAIDIVYDRCAYSYPGLERAVRITIDSNLLARKADENDYSLFPDKREYISVIPNDCCVMEIKTPDTIPLKLASVLSSLDIYPVSFSKVGSAYTRMLLAQH